MTFRILILACVFVFILFVGILLVSFLSKDEAQPIPDQKNTPTRGALIPTAPVGNKEPEIPYSQDGTDQLIEIAKQRPTPNAQSDIQIRESLINLVGGNTGVLYQSPLVKISYVKTPNDFEGEILSSNIQTAKDEAVAWLKKQGLTEDGICKLPVFFYLSPTAREAAKNSGQAFNPLPEFCI